MNDSNNPRTRTPVAIPGCFPYSFRAGPLDNISPDALGLLVAGRKALHTICLIKMDKNLTVLRLRSSPGRAKTTV
jgi:hypothetical protein